MISLGRRAIGDSKPSWSFRSRWTSEDYLSIRRAGRSELLLQFLLKLLDSFLGSLFLPTKHCNPGSQQLFSLPIKGCNNIHGLYCYGDEPEKSVGRCSQRDDIICEDLQF